MSLLELFALVLKTPLDDLSAGKEPFLQTPQGLILDRNGGFFLKLAL